MRGYEALRLGAAWRDLSARGRLRATGADRVRLLHAISSNDVEGLSPGRGTCAFFLSAQGRIQASTRILVFPDHVTVDCGPTVTASLRQHIESYIIMDDVTLENVTRQTALLALAGPEAGAIVEALGLERPAGALSSTSDGETAVVRSPAPGVDFWLLAAASAKDALEGRIRELGAAEASGSAWESLRLLHWAPRFGSDYGPRNIPHETRQFNAVSFSKGCYTGQEIVERVRSRGRVRRQLIGIELEGPSAPEGLEVRCDGRAVGTMTSPTPAGGALPSARGFAIVRTGAAAEGTALRVGGLPGRAVDVTRN